MKAGFGTQDGKTKRKTDKDHKGIEQKRRRGGKVPPAPLDPHDPFGDEGDDNAAAPDDGDDDYYDDEDADEGDKQQ